ncbi:serine aminopeptidase domain-containing protein [Sphingobium sp. CFD-1]|uniref:serine aminopeptidase domain-containing protein n=1 Tax=Sphingobium sp. CFD-1 TaxID=2878545 RepID=UPI00214C83F3|nr:alpha/beta hydrolase [Sphingobium sp. CFD-1]
MGTPIELTIDVTEAAGLGMPAHVAVSVFLPDADGLAQPPVVCFAFPGGGYNRRYYSFDMPDGSGGGEAGYHNARGWIVVACDHLGFGDSTIPDDDKLDLDIVAAANDATVRAIMDRIEAGTLVDNFPAVPGATRIGIGQSMGGCFAIVAQGNHETFDGIATLGYSGIHTIVPTRPGQPEATWPWISRRSPLAAPKIYNLAALAASKGPQLGDAEALKEAARKGEHPFQWSFHWDDEPADWVTLDMEASAGLLDTLPPWRSATTPACGVYMVAPGAVALEAASIRVPVLIAVGERDVVPDPWAEPKAFKSASDVQLFVCPRMAHMHNFAHTRTLFWERIQNWGDGVARMRSLTATIAD